MCPRKIKWLGLSLLWSGLLLAGLFAFALPPSTVIAAGAQMPTIAFSAATYRVNEGDESATVTLLVSPPSSAPITVTVSSTAVEGGAEAGKDFVGVRKSLAIAPGVQAVTLSVALLDDSLIEGEESLRLSVGSVRGAAQLGTITETTVIIEDDDFVYVGVGDVVVNEGAESVTLLITQSVVSPLTSVVDFRTVDGSATTPADYEATSGSISIPPGSTQAAVTIRITPDAEAEPTESFFFQLHDAQNVELAKATATVTILDDDGVGGGDGEGNEDNGGNNPAPQLEVIGAAASEADGILSFVVRLSSRSPQTVTVGYATADGTAIAPSDYLSDTGVLIIPPGSLTATVPVSLAHDEVNEPDETLFLRLTNPVQAILAVTQAEGIIHDSPRTSQKALFLPGLKR
ncbi:MAG: hypothetical protein IT328_12400 [Caldilineaceae bacterium]|nr:hypothetical protein [Caldilineaceae bacterium]